MKKILLTIGWLCSCLVSGYGQNMIGGSITAYPISNQTGEDFELFVDFYKPMRLSVQDTLFLNDFNATCVKIKDTLVAPNIRHTRYKLDRLIYSAGDGRTFYVRDSIWTVDILNITSNQPKIPFSFKTYLRTPLDRNNYFPHFTKHLLDFNTADYSGEFDLGLPTPGPDSFSFELVKPFLMPDSIYHIPVGFSITPQGVIKWDHQVPPGKYLIVPEIRKYWWNSPFVLHEVQRPVIIEVDGSLYTSTKQETYTNEVKLFPNPTDNILYFDAPEIPERVSIYTTSGQLAASYEEVSGNQLDISHLANGMYLLQFIFEGRISYQKVMKY